MAELAKPRLVGFNHVALEVGDIEEALAFYGRLFKFELRGKTDTMAFIDLGDQFIALQKGRKQPADDGRHFGLVVDDKETARKALEAAGVKPLAGPFLDFRDPWGNRVEIVGYDNIQFTKAPNVLRGMGLMHLAKNEKAKKELAEKGMGVLVASSEMPELLGLCDRVVVLRGGRTVMEFPGGANEHDVLAAAEANEEALA